MDLLKSYPISYSDWSDSSTVAAVVGTFVCKWSVIYLFILLVVFKENCKILIHYLNNLFT